MPVTSLPVPSMPGRGAPTMQPQQPADTNDWEDDMGPEDGDGQRPRRRRKRDARQQELNKAAQTRYRWAMYKTAQSWSQCWICNMLGPIGLALADHGGQ